METPAVGTRTAAKTTTPRVLGVSGLYWVGRELARVSDARRLDLWLPPTAADLV